MACKHQWKGTSQGVECIRCGEKLTAEEYAASLAPKKKKKKADN